ncbi:MAG: cell division protein FtsA, partial [Bacteroidota bacterium]
MENNEIVVGLDIGTTKICAIVGMRKEHGKIEILGMGKAESAGVSRGVVTNIEKTIKGIQQAIEEASNQSNCEISEVVVGIAGQHIKSLQHRGIITRNSTEDEISRVDVDLLIKDMYRLAMPPGEQIIHVIPQEFTVDNEQGVLDPIGMSGVRLEANFHVITAQITAANNILKCVAKASLDTTTLMLEPLASAEAVLGEEEKEAGVVLVDIGGGTTDIAIFYEGIIRHTAVIPFGGNAVTEDVREGCSVMKNTAEALKIKFGSALADENKEEEIISIQGLRGREPKEVSVKNLALIIQARMEEILEQVKYEIQSSGYEKKI